MSYILEALEIAERERRMGTPDLSVMSGAGGSKPARQRFWLIAAAALSVNALVLSAVFWPGPRPTPVEALNSPVGEPLPAVQDVVVGEPAPAPRVAAPSFPGLPPRPAEQTEIAAAEPIVPAPEIVRPLAEQTRTLPRLPPPAAAKPAAPQHKSESPPLDEPAPLATEASPKPTPPEAEPTAPLLSELPPAVRLRLPDMQVNVHVYAEDPAQRFVLINMRKYREGERIGRDGPVVNRITPEGVVIDYGAGLARL